MQALLRVTLKENNPEAMLFVLDPSSVVVAFGLWAVVATFAIPHTFHQFP
jgi:hypothetical protein